MVQVHHTCQSWYVQDCLHVVFLGSHQSGSCCSTFHYGSVYRPQYTHTEVTLLWLPTFLLGPGSLFVHMHGVLLRQLDLAIVLSVLIYDFLASREDHAVL